MGSKLKPSESHFGSHGFPAYAPERREHILQLLAQDGSVSVAKLASRLNVSEVTVRKDLAWLEERKQLVRTHGGAIAAGRRSELAFEVRQRLNRAEKEAIGAAATALVRDGESICLDASTTALEVARKLKNHTELTIVTNGLRIAAEFAGRPGITVLMPGGRVRWEAFSLVGTWGEALFRHINIQRAFVGAVGFTLEESLTDVTDEEAQVKRAMVTAAREVIALIDHTKWGRVALATFCELDSITRVITDARAPRDMVAAVRDRGIRVDVIAP